MKLYYEVYINAKVGNKLVLTTKSREKAFLKLNSLIKHDGKKWTIDGFIDEITDYGDGNESVDTIA